MLNPRSERLWWRPSRVHPARRLLPAHGATIPVILEVELAITAGHLGCLHDLRSAGEPPCLSAMASASARLRSCVQAAPSRRMRNSPSWRDGGAGGPCDVERRAGGRGVAGPSSRRAGPSRSAEPRNPGPEASRPVVRCWKVRPGHRRTSSPRNAETAADLAGGEFHRFAQSDQGEGANGWGEQEAGEVMRRRHRRAGNPRQPSGSGLHGGWPRAGGRPSAGAGWPGPSGDPNDRPPPAGDRRGSHWSGS